MIAMALVGSPKILIADEPTTALDVTLQAQILDLLNKLKKERGMSIIFITHDLGVILTIFNSFPELCHTVLICFLCSRQAAKYGWVR